MVKDAEALIIVVTVSQGRIKGYYIPVEKRTVEKFWLWYNEHRGVE